MAAISGEHVEHLYTLICSHAQAGPGMPTNLIGLMDMLAVADLPAGPAILPITCFLVSGWRRNRDPGCALRTRIVFEYADAEADVKPRDVVSPIHELHLQHLHLTTSFTQIVGLPLRGYGQYYFVAQKEVAPATWEDALPSAGLWIARPDWKQNLNPANPWYVPPQQ